MPSPLGWAVKYFIGAIVGASAVVQGIKILKFELGNNVEGVIFRRSSDRDRRKRDDE
jgi:hypothetical protein